MACPQFSCALLSTRWSAGLGALGARLFPQQGNNDKVFVSIQECGVQCEMHASRPSPKWQNHGLNAQLASGYLGRTILTRKHQAYTGRSNAAEVVAILIVANTNSKTSDRLDANLNTEAAWLTQERVIGRGLQRTKSHLLCRGALRHYRNCESGDRDSSVAHPKPWLNITHVRLSLYPRVMKGSSVDDRAYV